MSRHCRLLGLGLLLSLLVACLPQADPDLPVQTFPPPTIALILSTPTLIPTPAATAAPTNTMIPTDTAPAPTSTPTLVSPTPTATPTETPTVVQITPAAGQCVLTVGEETTVYQRPAEGAEVFSSVQEGFITAVVGVTEEGWLGFDPGIAQAGNIGVFRLRWVDGDGNVELEGACEDLTEYVGPPPEVCFTMALAELDVFAEPDTAAEVVASLELGDFAEVVARGEGWAQLDLSVGSTDLDVRGWIPEFALNVNGPCQDIPEEPAS